MIPEMLLYEEAMRLGDLFHAYANNCPFTGIDDIEFVNYSPRMRLHTGVNIIHSGGGVWFQKDGQLFRTYQQAIYDYTQESAPSGV